MTDAALAPRLTLLDRAIGWFNPRAGAERFAWRAAQVEQARAFAMASRGRRTSGWRADGSSANAEVAAGAQLIRWRARELVRNNPFAAGAVSKLAAATVGPGIVPRPQVEDLALRRTYMDQWNWFVEGSDPEGQLDFYGQMNVVARTVYESGEALIRLLPRPTGFGLKVPLQLQVLEPDWLDSGKTERRDDGGAIIQGVHYDKWGRRVGYWLFDEHPGEMLPMSLGGRFQSSFVPASQILHVFDPLRAGQARGLSAFAAVGMRLRDLDDLADAEVMRRKIAACFAAFVTKQPSATSPLSETSTDAAGKRIERLSPGLVQYLNPGEEVTFGNPPSADGVVGYLQWELHGCAVGAGVTYEAMTGDYSQTNYSSGRMGLNTFHELLDVKQWKVFVPQTCRPVWRAVDRVLYIAGERRELGVGANWSPPARRFTDPQKEIAAERDEVRAGRKTWDQMVAASGEDPDEQAAAIARRNAQFDEAGIVLDTDPRKTRPATQAAPENENQPKQTDKE